MISYQRVVIKIYYRNQNIFVLVFRYEDLREAPYVQESEIHRDREKGVLGLLQKAYIQKFLIKSSMHVCKCTPALVIKGNKLRTDQGLYTSAIMSIMHA